MRSLIRIHAKVERDGTTEAVLIYSDGTFVVERYSDDDMLLGYIVKPAGLTLTMSNSNDNDYTYNVYERL
jgi:hypothetical protein